MAYIHHFVLLAGALLLAPFVLLAEKQTIPVGVILPLSGDFAPYGTLVKHGVQQADSTGIELIFEDEGCTPKTTMSAFNKLVNINRVKFILGPSCGSPQKVLAPQIKRRNVIGMLTSSASEELFDISGGNYFAAQYSIEDESRFNAKTFNNKELKRTALVYFDQEFSRAHERAFLQDYRGQVVEIFRFSSLDSSTIRSIATKIRTLDLDSLYIPDASPMLFGLLTELAKLGVKDLHIHSIYSAQMKDVLDVEGKSANGLVYSYPDIPGEDAIAYFSKLAANLLFKAIRSCGNDTSCVRRWLLENNTFDARHTLRSKIALKTVREGRFARL